MEKENNDLKSKLMAEQRALVYLQKKFDKLFTAKQQNISLMRLPKYLEKIGNNDVTNCNIQCVLQIIVVSRRKSHVTYDNTFISQNITQCKYR